MGTRYDTTGTKLSGEQEPVAVSEAESLLVQTQAAVSGGSNDRLVHAEVVVPSVVRESVEEQELATMD